MVVKHKLFIDNSLIVSQAQADKTVQWHLSLSQVRAERTYSGRQAQAVYAFCRSAVVMCLIQVMVKDFCCCC